MKKYIMYSFFLFIVITVALSNYNCKKKTPTKPGTPPKASFTVSPDSGDIFTTFYVDASTSSDAEDDTSELQVRWDWQGNGIWDTEYTTAKADSHKYGTGGVHNITLQVKDSDGWTDNTSHTITVGGPCWHVIESPTTQYLFSVYFVSENDGWAVGDDGTIIHYDGNNWNIVESPVADLLESIYFIEPNDGWIVGGSGKILHYQGENWEEVASPTSEPLCSVFFVTPYDGWAVGGWGTILHYNGSSWNQVESPTSDCLFSVYFLSSINGWAGGGSVHKRNPTHCPLLHYDGENWEEVPDNPAPHNINSIYFINETDGWAIGDFFILHYDGVSWEIVETRGDVWVPGDPIYGGLDVYFVSASDGWIVGWSIFHWDGGKWNGVPTPIPILGSNELGSVYFLTEENGWAVGRGGTILHYARD